jgi:hypothetical protein
VAFSEAVVDCASIRCLLKLLNRLTFETLSHSLSESLKVLLYSYATYSSLL